MSNGILKIYALSVCFASLMCGAIATGFLLFNLVKIIAPTATIDPSTLNNYSSSVAFRNSPYNPENARAMPFVLSSSGTAVAQPLPTTDSGKRPKLSDEELEDLRIKRLSTVIANHQFRAKQGIILQTIIILITTVLFFTHWKLAKKLNGP